MTTTQFYKAVSKRLKNYKPDYLSASISVVYHNHEKPQNEEIAPVYAICVQFSTSERIADNIVYTTSEYVKHCPKLAIEAMVNWVKGKELEGFNLKKSRYDFNTATPTGL